LLVPLRNLDYGLRMAREAKSLTSSHFGAAWQGDREGYVAGSIALLGITIASISRMFRHMLQPHNKFNVSV
jgi:hypothetical protein